MKYIKLFEKYMKYKNGDYVFEDEYYVVGDYFRITPDWANPRVVSIHSPNIPTINQGYNARLIKIRTELENIKAEKYVFDIYDHITDTFTTDRVSYLDIKRRLTKEEVEEFELKKLANKYNLL